MRITGDLKIHKSDGVTRPAKSALVLEDGSLAVWDSIKKDSDGNNLPSAYDNPDIIVESEKWHRIEREGHHWKHKSPQALKERAKNRDDVDEDDLPDSL